MPEFYNPFEMPVNWLESLTELVNLLKEEDVEIEKFISLNGGIQLKFKGLPGDAVIHSFSHGHEVGLWETYKMPWDYGDVSVHDSETLAKLLGALSRKEDWEDYDD